MTFVPILIPDYIPAEKRESYRELMITKQLQELMVEHGLTQKASTTVAAYLLFKSFAQFDHPNVMMTVSQNLLNLTLHRVTAYAQHISLRADIAMKLAMTDRMAHRMWEASIGKAPLGVNISEEDFFPKKVAIQVPHH